MSKTSNEIRVEQRFFQLTGVPRTLAYIPSKTDTSRKYFSLVRSHYIRLGVSEVRYCDLDQEFSSDVLDSIGASSAIYLAGGFTPYFLETLQVRQALSFIRDFSKKNPVIGVSAGALILGRDISILFDDPSEGPAAKALSNANGVGLYDFEFWPHFGRFKTDKDQLTNRSIAKPNFQIVGCDDLSGLIVTENETRALGTAHTFFRGNHQLYRDEVLSI